MVNQEHLFPSILVMLQFITLFIKGKGLFGMAEVCAPPSAL